MRCIFFKTKEMSRSIFQYKISDMVTEYNLGLLACLEVADKVDQNNSIPENIIDSLTIISKIIKKDCPDILEI